MRLNGIVLKLRYRTSADRNFCLMRATHQAMVKVDLIRVLDLVSHLYG